MIREQKGFSLIELLLVVTIVGIIASIAVPFLLKAVGTSENANGYASLKTVSSSQVAFYSRNNRFGRLNELNSDTNNGLGTTDGINLNRGVFRFVMSPVNPTNEELKEDYQIIATKGVTISDTPCVMSLNGAGVITEIFGTNCINNSDN